MAEQCREQLELDRVLFVPAAVSPLKLNSTPRATEAERWEMIRMAISGNAEFSVDKRELKRGGTSYTVDTLQELKEENPEAELYFLMGADSLASFHTWKEPARICELAKVIVFARGGQPKPDLEMLDPFLPNSGKADLTSHQVDIPEMEISSSDVRYRIQNSKSTRYQLHPAVQAFIDAKEIYRS